MSKFMEIAIEEAREGIKNGHGGPFGAVVVKDGEIIGRGHNCVLKNNDPTAHGEVMAIRNACQNLNTFDLSGAVLYTTCYPCPMCLCAMMWANIDKCYYGCTSKDADEIGFRDDNFYDKIASKEFYEKFNVCANSDDTGACETLFKDYLDTEHKLY